MTSPLEAAQAQAEAALQRTLGVRRAFQTGTLADHLKRQADDARKRLTDFGGGEVGPAEGGPGRGP